MRNLPAIKEKLRRLPKTSGVYVMKDSLGNVIYIGKAVNLKRRVGQYFMNSYKTRASNPKIASLVDCIADFEFFNTRSDAEAVILESKLIKRWKPRYNTLEKDNKNFLLLRVETFAPLPRFAFARHRKEDGAMYFGPYLGTSAIRSALTELKKKFGILLSDAHPKKLENGKWRLYDDARSQITNFEASDALDFEKAAKWRDLIAAIEETRVANARGNVEADISASPADIAIAAMDSLRKTLGMKKDPQSIECFDISHISGSFCVASMVRFEFGEPAKQKYRRFKIKSFVGNDDFRAMREAVGRRYARLHREGLPMPDLILIDGGKGQVFSALKAFDEEGITPPKIIGLAKKEETIVTDSFEEKLLPRRHEGLKLLQRVRDEAHRFANSFSESLRSRKIRESILDDFPGLGEKRKKALLEHFGSISKIKAATVGQLREVDGIGFETAAALREFLDANFPAHKNEGQNV